MRIVSLLPSATEIVCALGLADDLLGVTDECDHPGVALGKRVVVRSRQPAGLTAGEIDAWVRAQAANGGLYVLDDDALTDIAPDLVLTQDLCRVCAVATTDVDAALRRVGCPSRVVTLEPQTLDDVLASVITVADAADVPVRGQALRSHLQRRLDVVAAAVAGRTPVRTLVLEWLDPPFTPGHWLPDVVRAAGGDALLGRSGQRSVATDWDVVLASRPDVVILAPVWDRAGRRLGPDPPRSRRAADHADLRRRAGPSRAATGRRGRGPGRRPASRRRPGAASRCPAQPPGRARPLNDPEMSRAGLVGPAQCGHPRTPPPGTTFVRPARQTERVTDSVDFAPATRAWLDGAFAAPTPAQLGAWAAIRRGDHTLVVAPTGSGKTLAAFLSALDRLAREPKPEDPRRRCRVVYVSPLKALAVDVERNLRSPLAGIRQASVRLGLPSPDITVATRSGDTPQDERRKFARTPADILITTPESLFLLLTSRARESLFGVDTVIIDEVHAVCASKRGAHLALSLERLDALLERPAQRIGLSATVRPVDEVSTFLAGGRPVTIVQPQDQQDDRGPGRRTDRGHVHPGRAHR